MIAGDNNNNTNFNRNGNNNNVDNEAVNPDEPMGHYGGPIRQNPEPPRLSSLEQFKKNNQYELMKLGCMATCILINLFALPQVNKGCDFTSTRFNMLFFYMVVLTETVMRILYQYVWITNDAESNQKRNFLVKAFSGLLYAIWTIYVLRTF